MDRGAWWAAVHGVARSRTQLSDFTFTFHFHALEKEKATHSSVLAWRIPGMGDRWISALFREDWAQISSIHSEAAAAAAAKSLQSCPTLCDPIDGSPPGSPFPGILQARTLGWVAISFSNAWKWKVKVKSLSCVRLLRPHGLWPTRFLCPWDSPGKSTGVGCHFLLQGIFPIQESNPCLLHCRQILYRLS